MNLGMIYYNYQNMTLHIHLHRNYNILLRMRKSNFLDMWLDSLKHTV